VYVIYATVLNCNLSKHQYLPDHDPALSHRAVSPGSISHLHQPVSLRRENALHGPHQLRRGAGWSSPFNSFSPRGQCKGKDIAAASGGSSARSLGFSIIFQGSSSTDHPAQMKGVAFFTPCRSD
jgi:hypothetical protein